jgi:hypothetical protein
VIGAVGLPGRLGQGRWRAPAAAAGSPDFTLSSTAVVTAWGVVSVGTLVPSGVDPETVSFVLVGNPAGLAAVNG